MTNHEQICGESIHGQGKAENDFAVLGKREGQSEQRT